MKEWGLVGQLAARSASSVGDRVLDTLLATCRAQGAALFRREQRRLTLFSIRHVAQAAVDLVHRAWAEQARDLEAGRMFLGRGAGGCFVLVPVVDPRFLGLLYAERFEPWTDADRETLVDLARIASAPLAAPDLGPHADVGAFLSRTPPDAVAREQLLVVLEQCEWNLSRVARQLGVARMTIYNWLGRHGIERRRVSQVGAASFARV